MKTTHDPLIKDLDISKRLSFLFGAKLVRGAYMNSEPNRYFIHDTLVDAHNSYQKCINSFLPSIVSELSTNVSRTNELMIATHNVDSVLYVMNAMNQLNIPKKTDKIIFAQLLGMADHITFSLAKEGYTSYKYVPFGSGDMVGPYLMRCLEENTDVVEKSK